MELTSRERVERMLKRQPVDRIPANEHFWGDTRQAWIDAGHLKPDENLEDHFDLDIRKAWPFSMAGNLDVGDTLIEETEETKLVRNSNGALLRWWKHKSGTPEHVDFLVKDRAAWEEHIRPHLTNDADLRRRINFDAYRDAKKWSADTNRFFFWSGVNVFELMHPVCGHEYMLMGMALDPDWVKDMCTVYADLTLKLMDILFDEEGLPDGVWFYEDMGFKHRPFMSPAMYMDIIWPAHKRTFQYARQRGLEVVVHSCGFVEPLVPGLIEAGMTCLQAMEVKAGMDLPHLKQAYGDRIAFMGGMDIRTLESNDLATVDAELELKLPPAMAGGGYCLQTDHSVSSRVNYETFKHFVDRGREMGRYAT